MPLYSEAHIFDRYDLKVEQGISWTERASTWSREKFEWWSTCHCRTPLQADKQQLQTDKQSLQTQVEVEKSVSLVNT